MASVLRCWVFFVAFCPCWLLFVFGSLLHCATPARMNLSFYTRPRSPWVWVAWCLGAGKPRTCERTRLRKDDPERSHKEAILRLDWQRRLLQSAGATTEQAAGRQGWAWVPGWLTARWRAKPRTLHIYEIHWRWLFDFFCEQEVGHPAGVTRAHCFDYVEWRTRQVKQKSGRNPKMNTALGELKLLRQVMAEAIARGLVAENPASKLGIEREEVAPKPDISDAEAEKIYAALESEPRWMQRSFFLAFNTGLRIATTRVHRAQVHWEEGRIIIERPKGGRKREFAIEIYPAIEPMLRAWWESGEEWLWTAPKGAEKMTSLHFMRFFRKIGLPHLCFHCTRVAFITRGAMNGVPEAAMMQMVNHARGEVHRIYQRWKPTKFREYAAQISAGVKAPPFASPPTL